MTLSTRVWFVAAFTTCVATVPPAAMAQTNDGPAQSDASPRVLPGTASDTQSPVASNPETSSGASPGGLFERDKLLGPLGGVRPTLEAHGVTLNLNETSEVLGNVSGGRATGLVYEGVTNISADIDGEKAFGVPGGTIRISALQIHGRGLSTNYVDNLNVVSSAEATRATRLFELWYQQKFFGGKADIRVGQQSADLEFGLSAYGGLFVNGSFGWPTSFAVSLPAGGPAYPLASLGARLRLQPTADTTVLLAVFNGNPARPGSGDPQIRNAHGTSFRLNDGVFAIGEVQYAVNGGSEATGLPGTYKLGGWYHSRAFTNQFFVSTIGSANANPTAANPNDDWSFYGVADQLVWRVPGSTDGGVGVFGRLAGAPGGRNQINVFANAGVTYKGIAGRAADTVGLGLAWARISDTSRANDAAAAAASPGSFFPVRSSEVAIELTYQAQIAPWWAVQPTAQYVFNPGGGIVNPDRPNRRIGDAAILGIRTTIAF